MANTTRLLVLGHTGLGKGTAVKNLARGYLSAFHQVDAGLDHINDTKYLRVACLEDSLDDIHGFLDLTNEVDAKRRWLDALRLAVSGLQAGPAEAHQILSLHGSYYRKSRAFSRANLEEIRDGFRPTAVVVLIDDIYEVASMIRRRNPLDALRLREIAAWRSIEGMIADFIATPLDIPSYTLSVKHPVSMAVSLLFTNQTRVYSAFPISRHRDNVADRRSIETFKERLRTEGFVVFDPATIDELLLRSALEDADPGSELITLKQEDRWNVANGPLLSDSRESGWQDGLLTFSRGEVAEATQDIARQVESRDFRLIHDSEFLVAYRPSWGGNPSRGVTAELHLARGIGRRAFIFSPPGDESSDDSPFADLGEVYGNEDELFEALRAARKTKA